MTSGTNDFVISFPVFGFSQKIWDIHFLVQTDVTLMLFEYGITSDKVILEMYKKLMDME